MIKNVIFYISIISFILLPFLIFEMLPFIFESGFQGILFLIFIIITFVCEIVMLIINKSIVKNSLLSNISIIVATIYISFLYYNIYNSNGTLYGVSVDYFKNNYFLLSMIFVFIISNMIINYICDKKRIL